MATIGYARVSTRDQDLTIQREALTAAGCSKIYAERRNPIGRSLPGYSRPLSLGTSKQRTMVAERYASGATMAELAKEFEVGEERGNKSESDDGRICIEISEV